MKSDIEILSMINEGRYGSFISSLSDESASIVKEKINEIPGEFFKPTIDLGKENGGTISLIQFCISVGNLNDERKNGLMRKYSINPYDMNKIQSIVESIKVVGEYGLAQKSDEEKENKHKEFGFELADKESLDKAYPLWIAYLYADSKNPLEDISARLIADGTNGKYTAEYIVGLIEHTNSLMLGKSEDEKKDFYMSSISGILGKDERFSKKERESIEI